VGWPAPLQPDEAPPAGLEPAASGLRARRHLPFDHGGVSSGGRDRTCASRVTVARLTARPHRNRRKERESNPQGPEAHPFSRRDTAPVAVLPGDPGRTRTCTSPIKSRPLCRIELRSQRRGRQESNLHAPRFKRALYRWSYDHRGGRGWTRTSDLLFVRQALSRLSYSPERKMGGAGIEPASSSVSERRSPLSYPPARAPGQGLEPRSPRSERGVLPP
jgi:hypothetical protein